MIESNTLGAAAGVQYQGVTDKSESARLPDVIDGVIIGRFKRGRMDKPFTVTANNYQALLGEDPFNPSYTLVDDVFIAGANKVMVMRIGDPKLDIEEITEIPAIPLEPSIPINQPASVRIVGSVAVGEVLAAEVVDQNGVPSNATYKWMVNGVQVGTNSAYRVTDSDQRKRITVQVVFTDSDGFEEDVTSAPTDIVPAVSKPAKVSISGTARVGGVLTAVITDANGVPSNITYSWLVNNIEVSALSSYQLKDSDKGKTVTLRVMFTDNDGFKEDVTSAPTGQVSALNRAASVRINGVAKVGEKLTNEITDTNGVPSNVSYKWMANGVQVGTNSAYTLTENEKGKRISLRVTFTDNDGFKEDVTSAATGSVLALNKTASVTIKGVAKVGETLTSEIIDLNGVPSNVSYRWQANDLVIGSDSRYTLTENEKGKRISLRVIFTDSDGFGEDVTSAQTNPVLALNKPASVRINGVAKVGEKLTAIVTDGNGVTTNTTHKWVADGSTVGAASTYVLTEADEGKRVSVNAIFTDNDGFKENVTSAQTVPVVGTRKQPTASIDGALRVGDTVRAVISDTSGVWGMEQISYQWIVDDFEIAYRYGVDTYTLTEDEKGKRVRVFIKYQHKEGFFDSITSPLSAIVQPLNKPAVVTVVGVLQAGRTLRAIITDGNGVPANIAYKWMANGVQVGTATTYKLTASNVGKKISLRTTFKDNDGILEDKTTTTSAVVRAARPVQPPPVVLPANTPFTFKTTNNNADAGELDIVIRLSSPTADWALYRNGELIANEGFTGDGISQTGRYNDDYVRINLYGDKSVNTYKFTGGSRVIEIERFGAREEGAPHGVVDIQGFSSSINEYKFKIKDSLLTVPSRLASNITRTSHMFEWCNLFNQDISGWNMVNVTVMDSMFSFCGSFNQPVGDWDVSNVVYMNRVFDECSAFNQPLRNWDTSSVIDMTGLFSGAKSFNQPIGDWDVSNVVHMNYIFIGAHVFNQDLSQWCVPNIDITIDGYDTNTFKWTEPRPVWGTCPRGEDAVL